MPKIPQVLAGLVVLAAVGGGVSYWRSLPPKIDVVLPQTKTVTESIAASGRLRGELETSVGARVSGRVASVAVREGDKVRSGQILARLDDEVLRSQLAQAQDAVLTARAALGQAQDAIRTAQSQVAVASRNPLPSDITRLKADTNQAVLVAEARLAVARQKLIFAQRRFAELRKGPRDEEIDATEAQVRQAEASLAQADRDRNRQVQLAKEGAVSQAAADQAETGFWVAKRTLENAQARLRQLKAGTRPEQLEQAEADTKAAESEIHASEATVTGARASGKAQLISLLASPRAEDITVTQNRVREATRAREVAQARLAEAERAQEVAKQRLADVIVTAPFEGTVTQIVTEAGGVTGPNAALVRLVRTSVPEIRIDLDEVNLGKLQTGQEAVVASDAYPSQTFRAKVRELGAQVDTERGTVEVRLTPVNPPAWLRPGQTLSVNIKLGEPTSRLVIPLTSVTTIGGISTVLIVDGDEVKKKVITAGPPGPDGIPVLAGLEATTQVLLNPVGHKPGDKLEPVIVKPSPGPGR
nr:efflux RND transporter periplasmic adaptor subunit [Armatimonas sp.]